MFKPNILITLAAGVALSVLSWYYYSYMYNKDSNYFRGYDIEGGNFFAVNTQKNTYNIKAQSIRKIDKNLYELNKIYAKYNMDQENAKYAEAVSRKGIFNESKNLLTLTGDVECILSEGYRATTDKLAIDTKNHTAHTNTEILVSGSQGKIMSKNGMTLYMKKKKLVFHGPIQSMFVETKSKSK